MTAFDEFAGVKRFVVNGLPLTSIHSINALDPADKSRIYLTLLPLELLRQYDLDIQSTDDPRLKLVCLPDTTSVELAVYHPAAPRDPLLYLQLADTTTNQLMVLLFIVNDPHSPRFDVDRDWKGEPTKFGTLKRNIEAEVAAMQAGLLPGQVRRGLKLSRQLIPIFETFVSRLGHKLFLLDPLAYHNAILFERYGCAYSVGRKQMEWINREFAPGGELYNKLDGSTPFRQPSFHRTVHGRSWAIHDGIMGQPFTDIKMYKRVGIHAGINTFPQQIWE